jgi:hypothetical protein
MKILKILKARGAKIVFEKIKYVKLMRRAFIKLSGS